MTTLIDRHTHSRRSLHGALEQALKLVLRPDHSSPELLAAAAAIPRFMRERLTFAEHFDINPAFFILDSDCSARSASSRASCGRRGRSAEQLVQEVPPEVRRPGDVPAPSAAARSASPPVTAGRSAWNWCC